MSFFYISVDGKHPVGGQTEPPRGLNRIFRRRCTDVQIPPVFYKTSFPFGAEALLTSKATIEKSLSRARVPETISCLWATGFSISVSHHPSR